MREEAEWDERALLSFSDSLKLPVLDTWSAYGPLGNLSEPEGA